MKVLFYIEPHPIRDMLVHFKDIAISFLPLLEMGASVDARLFANAATLEAIQNSIDKHSNKIIRPSAEDERIIEHYRVDWLSEGLPIWLELMAGGGQVSNNYLQMLQRIWQRFPFDLIVHWGENGAVSRFVKERSITRIAMELGCTRPPFFDSLVMDPYGTNGSGIVPKLSISDLRNIVDDVPMSRHEAMFAYAENLETKPYEQQFHPLSGDLVKLISKSERIAFFPLQLFDDANLLRFSPYKTLSDAVLDVVPKLAAAGYTTIITPHPATKLRPQGAFATTLAKVALNEWADQILWLDPGPNRPENAQLIAMSDVVVTVNSSVGFESLYFDKPVVVLGDAIYKPKDLFPKLEEFLSGSFDRTSYLKGVGWLRRFFLGGYLQSARIRSDYSSFERLIGLVDRLHRYHAGDPAAIAKGFWQATSHSTQTYAESAAFSGRSVAGHGEFGNPPIAASKPNNAPQYAFDCPGVEWLPVAQRLLKNFSFSDNQSFTGWLRETVTTRRGLETIVTIGNILNRDHYLELHPDVKKAGVEPLLHYVHQGLIEKRAPQYYLPGVSENALIDYLSSAASLLFSLNGNLLANYPLAPDEYSWRERDLEKICSMLEKSRRRIAVVAHLYYSDLVPAILENLKAIPEEFDLIVTMPTWGTRRIEALVRAAYPNAMFYHAANRGRDVGPFVDLLPILFKKNYDAVLKIQTKRGYYVAGKIHPEFGDLWREDAFDALLGDTDRVAAILNAFRSMPDLMMVGAESHYLALADYPYHDRGILAQMVLGEAAPGGFFAGTMFWIQPSCLRPLIDTLGISITSFAIESGANDGVLAHLIERLFGHAAKVAGAIVFASTDRELPLRSELKPQPILMHERMQQRLNDKRVQAGKKGKTRALLW